MKFVCDRCQTRYSIADDKVRGKILKVRCKSCQNVITVREAGAAAAAEAAGPQVNEDRTVLAAAPSAVEPVAPPRQSAVMPAVSARPGAPPPAPPPARDRDDVQWYMALDGNRSGPYSRKGLVDKLAVLPNGADVHVWNEKLDGWKPPEQVPVVARELQARRRPVLPPVPTVPGHIGPHPVPGTRGRTTSGSQPALAAAPALPRKTAHSLPAPSGEVQPAGHDLPLAAAAVPTEAPAARGKKAANGISHGSGEHGGVTAAPSGTLEPSVAGLNGDAVWTDVKEPPPAAEMPTGAPASIGGNDVVHAAPAWQASSVPIVATPKNRSVKLILASLGLVAVIIAVLTFSLFGKKAPSPVVEAPKSAAQPENSFSQLADKLAQQAKESPSPAPLEPPPPKIVELPKEPAAATAVVIGRPVKGGKGKKIRRGQLAARGPTAPTSPPPLSTTPPPAIGEAPPAAPTYWGSERQVQLHGAGGGARTTPQQGDISRVINNNKAGIKICYQRALLKDSTLTHGKINVHVTLGLSGKVKNVGIEGPPAFLSLQPCIKELVSRWAFPPSSEQYEADFAYVFQGNE